MCRYLILTGLALAGLAFFGCASQGRVPTAADLAKSLQTPAAAAQEHSGGVALWGYYNVFIDPKTWEAKVVPLRGPDFTVDVVSFMQPPMGKTSNLKILVTDSSQWFDQGKITADVTLTHPFPGLDAYTGHDVMGVLVSPGSINGLYDSGVWYSNGVDDVKLLNADGYTRWMNPTEFMPNGTILNFVPGMMGTSEVGLFTATIDGYKYFADNLGISQSVKEYYTDPNNAHNRGQFRAGVANTREYQLQFPFDGMPMMIFQYAVIAHWVEATELDPSDIPGSFPQSANADEAIYMEVAADNSDLWYAGGDGGGGISLDLEVFDQGGPYNPEGVPGEIGDIVVESHDGLIPGNYAVIPGSVLAATAKPGTTGVSSIVTVDIPNCTPHGLTFANPLMITVESADPITFDPGTGVPPTNAKLGSYFFYAGLTVDDQVPFAYPVTDLSLKVNRVSGGTAIESIQLDWTNTNGVEYAVYWDTDPYDNGGVINIDYTTSVMVVPAGPAIITSFDPNGGYVFTVKARFMAGDPTSEAADSNLAFVEMEDGGPDASYASNWTMGGNSGYPGQMMMQRVGPGDPLTSYGYFVDNGTWANACMDMWSCLSSPQIPDIPGAKVAYIEWAHWYFDCWKASTFPGCVYSNNYPGFTGGGAIAPPPLVLGYADPNVRWLEYDAFYDQPSTPPEGVGDPATNTGLANPSFDFFYGSPTYSAMWHGTNQNWLVSRVNAGLTAADIDYAAVTCSTHSTLNNWSANEGHYFMDDLAVVVY